MNSVLTLVCYVIRVSILDTGLLAATLLERISLRSLQDFVRVHSWSVALWLEALACCHFAWPAL